MGFEHLIDALTGLIGEGGMTERLAKMSKAVREHGCEPELLSYGLLFGKDGHVVLMAEGDGHQWVQVLIEYSAHTTH